MARHPPIPLIILLFQSANRAWSKNWPCPIGPSPTCPGFPALSCEPRSYSCPPPPCENDGECYPLRCLHSVGTCEDYPEPKPEGTKCAKHSECGMQMLCLGGKCEDEAKGGRTGSYRHCAHSADCPPMEDCEQGICLIRQEPGNEVEREEALNVWSTGWCSPMGECPGGEFQVCLPVGQFTRGQCFPREFYNEIGQLIPPPPGHPHCRDANSPPSHTSIHCRRRIWLCEEPIYRFLMGEQCPRSCGHCENTKIVERLQQTGRVQSRLPSARNMPWPMASGEVPMEMASSRRMRNRIGTRTGCLDRSGSECRRLAHLCRNSVYRRQLARRCARTCRLC